MDILGTLIVYQGLLSWRSLVDIVLMTAGLFVLYRTFLRLGTWKIATGILVAVAIYLLARLLELRTVAWVFGNFSQVAVIALIILFQPELRKFFERTASMRSARTRDPGDVLSRLIAYTLFTLAKENRGALVVFPGREPIEGWVSGGYPMDATPSIPLLRSIFDPHSPGHDGALIVDRGRFARLGVRLPVSESQQLSDEFGTRHHAAMGLSEKSDALIALVSEERGRVSLFYRGEMRPLKHADELVNAIVRHWKETASYPFVLPGGQRARREVISQLFASLALAVVFWSMLVIGQGERLEKIITAMVDFTASPPNLVLVGEKEKEVRLHLAGTRSDLDLIDPDSFRVTIDLSKAVAGNQTFVVTSDNMRLPRGVDLLDVVPASIELSLAELTEKEIPIKPQLVGKLSAGVAIRSVVVNPSHVRVLLPPDMAQFDALMTTPIYLEGLQGRTTLYCKVIAPPALQPVDRRWPDVAVTITMDK